MLSKACMLQGSCLTATDAEHSREPTSGGFVTLFRFLQLAFQRIWKLYVFLKRQLCFEPVGILKDLVSFSPLTHVWFNLIGNKSSGQRAYTAPRCNTLGFTTWTDTYCNTALSNNLRRLRRVPLLVRPLENPCWLPLQLTPPSVVLESSYPSKRHK